MTKNKKVLNGNNMRLYAARDKKTGKLVSGITNPSHKFWQSKGTCQRAIDNYNFYHRNSKMYDLEIVEFELVEIKGDKNEESN